MTFLDWGVIAVYLLVLLVVALVKSRTQADVSDYYLAGRTIKWWQSGASTMATQLGAISFVSAPAFVALKDDGGLKWLCYEFGVPLGLLVVIVLILPILHRGNHISIYEYLEERFDRNTRLLVSLLFQLGRGLATAVAVLAGGLVLSTALPISTTGAIIILGIVTVLYDMLGGIRVVILSDVFQMLIILLGIIICGAVALQLVGWEGAWNALGADRLRILDFKSAGFTPEGEYAFWPMALGGIFLYASYYGCDQSQVQRELSVGRLADVRRSLMVNAVGRFPVVLLYCFMGVFVGAVFSSPDLVGKAATALGLETATVTETLRSDPDRMVPMFVLAFLPSGIVGLVFVAVMSAFMSSLDSAINSLSAVTMEDFYKPHVRPDASTRHYLVASKVLTLFWGIFCIVTALAFGSTGEATRQTTIVLINAVGSLLYGPILAAFLIGMTTRRVGAGHIKAGVLAGIVSNVLIWQFTTVSWLWWNLAGFGVSSIVSTILYAFQPAPRAEGVVSHAEEPELRPKRKWRNSYTVVIFYFFLILFVSYLIQTIT